MDEIQILSVIDSFDGIAQSGKNKGQPYTKKTLSIMYRGKPTEVSAFVIPDSDYYFKVGEIYEGSVVKYRDKLTFKPTDKIIKSDEPAPEPNKPPKSEPLKEEPKAITEHPGEFNPPPPTEYVYSEPPESAKEKSMRKMNILNNAVAKLCAIIKISQPVGGDGTKQVIAFGDAHFNIDDLLKKYILEFQKYYKEE